MSNIYALHIDYKKQKEWNKASMWLEMSIGAVAGGLFVASLIFKFSLGEIVAVLAMLLGKGLLLLPDLGRPGRALRVLAKPGNSWVSKGAWGLMVFAVAGVVSVATLILPGLSWVTSGWGGMLLWVIAGVAAVFMMTYDGFLLGDSKGVEFWSNGSLPIVFLSSAAVGGLGALLALAQFGSLTFTPALASVNLAALILAAISLYALLRATANGTGGAKKSTETLLRGDLALAFHLWVLGIGLIVPLCVSLFAAINGSVPVLIWEISGALQMLGVAGLRYCILKAGMYSPVI